MENPDIREQACRALGIADVQEAHQIILQGLQKGTGFLLSRRLDARHLVALGYSAEGMRKLGFDNLALERLGYGSPAEKTLAETPRGPHALLAPELESLSDKDPRKLIALGFRAAQLKHEGVTVHHCLGVGIEPRTLCELGFALEDLAGECRPTELRSLGFNARELNRFFSGQELKNMGFSASEMRNAGFSVRQLLNFGYNENHIITAGYSLNDLVREGLSTRTSDKLRH